MKKKFGIVTIICSILFGTTVGVSATAYIFSESQNIQIDHQNRIDAFFSSLDSNVKKATAKEKTKQIERIRRETGKYIETRLQNIKKEAVQKRKEKLKSYADEDIATIKTILNGYIQDKQE